MYTWLLPVRRPTCPPISLFSKYVQDLAHCVGIQRPTICAYKWRTRLLRTLRQWEMLPDFPSSLCDLRRMLAHSDLSYRRCYGFTCNNCAYVDGHKLMFAQLGRLGEFKKLWRAFTWHIDTFARTCRVNKAHFCSHASSLFQTCTFAFTRIWVQCFLGLIVKMSGRDDIEKINLLVSTINAGLDPIIVICKFSQFSNLSSHHLQSHH